MQVYHSIQKVQNLGNERRQLYKKLCQNIRSVRYYICEIFGNMFHANLQNLAWRRPSWYPFEGHKLRTISFRETLSYFRKWRHNAVNLSTRTTRGEWFKLISGKIVLMIFFLRPKSRRKFRLNN